MAEEDRGEGFIGTSQGVPIYHDLSSFRPLLLSFLREEPAAVALGPLYTEDPAAELMAPFVRSAEETGWEADELQLAPDRILERAAALRFAAVPRVSDMGSIVEWTRAGVVLAIGSRWGTRVIGRGLLHPRPRMLGSVTGRFGYEGAPLPGGGRWNPLNIPEEERDRVVPSSSGRSLAVIDFRGMDLCSMIGIVPGLAGLYEGAEDVHARTAELVGMDRERAKLLLFVYAYGGAMDPDDLDRFCGALPPLRDFISGKPHGEVPRMVQRRSAETFRAALSRALPALVHPDCRPLFAVHDEIVLDVAGCAERRVLDALRLMEEGASERSAVHHSARLQWGKSYMEAKAKE